MPIKFLESLSGKLAESWVANLLTPAFVFWLGGLGAWTWRFSWKPVEVWLKQQSELLQITLLGGCLLVIAASAFVIQRFDLLVLRFLEGYWAKWMNPLRCWLIQRQKFRLNRDEKRWQQLADKKNHLTAEEQEEYISIDWRLMQLPAQPHRLMPTRLGNLLRAAESRPLDKYGLDAVICWPRLWLVLPDGVKKELQEARADLNTASRFWLWSMMFLIWTIWAWWAVPASLLAAFFSYYWALDAAAIYCDLLESAFDLHRLDIYKSLRWPVPANPANERKLGMQLTEYLWRGSEQEQPEFTLIKE
ncbi:hypothetical protein LC612_39260 [Nostoc sp. CHAB 5834]|nr:hypothetical protein [Nostoc sp. CHAB 5834]